MVTATKQTYTLDGVRELAARGREFAKLHAKELAVEIIEWQDTSVLRDGKLRELARLLEPLASYDALSVAQNFATRACLDVVAALRR